MHLVIEFFSFKSNINNGISQLPVISARTYVQESGEQLTGHIRQGECANEGNNSQRIISAVSMISANQAASAAASAAVSPARSVKKIEFQAKAEIISCEAGSLNKHVDFQVGNVVGSIDDEESEELEADADAVVDEQGRNHTSENQESQNGEENEANESNSSGHFKLRRRDTPHHLKGARLNSPKAQQLDPSEMKEILERYTSGASMSPNGGDCHVSPKGLSSSKHEAGTSQLKVIVGILLDSSLL
jgi:hypothetical protein